MSTKVIYKRFNCWQDDLEEKWLEEKALEGLHLIKLNTFGRYVFEVGECKNVKYNLDYKTDKTDHDNYIATFSDAGWEYVTKTNGWQYFRYEYDKDEPCPIYSDVDSKIAKMKSVINRQFALIGLYFPIAIITFFYILNYDSSSVAFISGFFTGASLSCGFVVCMLIINLNKRIKKLRLID